MTNDTKQAVKAVFKKIGKAIWSAILYVFMWIGLVCWFALLFASMEESTERTKQLAALEAENALYEAQQTQLIMEIDWLHSRIDQEGADGQTQP